MDYYEQLEHEIKEARELIESLCPVNQEGPHQDALHALAALEEKEDAFLGEFWGTVHTRLTEREVTS